MVSAEFPPWKIAQRLGTGTLTEAFLVEGPNGPAVLKRLLPFYAEHELLSALFILRGEEVRALQHPAIVSVLSTGTVGRDRYIVMEKAEGRALSRAIARMEQKGFRALPQIPVIACAYQAAKALAYAHSRGVFHLDVTLHNLYLAPSGHVRVSDFGLAHTRRSYAPDAGSQELIPPELGAGAKPDPRVDIWQLAASTYQLLAGGLPPNALFRGFPPLNLRIDGADETVSALLMRSLSPIPSERPLAMAELVAGLGTWLDRVGVKDAAAAAATLYRNVFEDGPEEPGWSVPSVHPWPDAEGTPHQVFGANESTPTSPKGPLPSSPLSGRKLWLVAGAATGLIALGFLTVEVLLSIGRHDLDRPLMNGAPPVSEQLVAPPPVSLAPLAPPSSENAKLPLNTSQLPAEFVVSSKRHGFYLEDDEGAGVVVSTAPAAGTVAMLSGFTLVPALHNGDSRLARSTAARVEGAFAVLSLVDGSRHVVFTDVAYEFPYTVTEARFGFFTDRSGTRMEGNTVVYVEKLGAQLQLSQHGQIHLEDDERFTVSGLNPRKEYEVYVEGPTDHDGLVVLLQTESRGSLPVVHGARGAAGQFLLPAGFYRVEGARGLCFTLPRSGEQNEVRYKVKVQVAQQYPVVRDEL